MADAQLQVVIKARNDAKKAFNELGGQVKGLQGSTGFGGLNDKISAFGDKFKSLTGISLGFATAAGAAGAAVMGLGKFLADSVNETVAYATQIDNMSRLLGISTEDTSRLVQASDDLFISQEKLQAALQAATRQGIDVSIEGLKKLSEQYLALPPGVARSEFVLKTFGRSGAEMGKLMEQGAAGIEAATAAIADNLIITKNSMGEIMNYKRSVDNLTDSWTGFKMEVGQAVIPQLDHLLRQLTSGKDAVELYQDQIYELNIQIQNLEKYGRQGGLSQAELEAQVAALNAEIERLNQEMYGTQDAAAAAEQSLLDLSNAGATYYSQFKTIAQEEQRYKENMGEINTKIGELITEKQRLIAEGYGPESAAIKEVSAKLQEQQGIAGATAAAHEDATNRIVLGFIEQGLAAGGLTDLEAGFLIDLGIKWGIYGEEMKTAWKDAIAERDKYINGQGEIITDYSINVGFHVNYEGLRGGIGKAEIDAGLDINGNGIVGQAKGGPVSANTPYIVGEVGPELFVPNTSGTIIPNNKLSSGGGSSGGSTVINFTYAPALSLSDRAEFETRVIPMMRRLISKAG